MLPPPPGQFVDVGGHRLHVTCGDWFAASELRAEAFRVEQALRAVGDPAARVNVCTRIGLGSSVDVTFVIDRGGFAAMP